MTESYKNRIISLNKILGLNTEIENIPNLEEVGKLINCERSNIRYLDKLKKFKKCSNGY